MTDTDLKLVACQLGDCRNAAALTVTIELPTTWTESREYTTRTLLVAVCGECAPVLEADARALLEARVRYAARLDIAGTATRLYAQLVGLIEAVGPPFEPVQGGVFARWLADLDRPIAQNALRRLADVKRKAVGGRRADAQAANPHVPAGGRPAPVEVVRLRRPALRRPTEPPPRGGDDAA